MTETLPSILADKVRAFLADGKTGSIVLDIKEGRVLAWKITEAGRVDKSAFDKFT